MSAGRHIEVLVEEPSMEATLRTLIPAIIGDVSFAVYPHQCKDELLSRLPSRLRGYASWLPESHRIIVVMDRDNADCRDAKSKLEAIVAESRLTSRQVNPVNWQAATRLAIEELEAWFFGDWNAVRQAYPRVSPHIPSKTAYRDPDEIRGGTWEALERILRRAGYFEGGLRKIEAARSIAPYMDPHSNRSASFQAFRRALVDAADLPLNGAT